MTDQFEIVISSSGCVSMWSVLLHDLICCVLPYALWLWTLDTAASFIVCCIVTAASLCHGRVMLIVTVGSYRNCV